MQTQGTTKTVEQLNEEIKKQGDLVRNLKGQKATKTDIDSAVKVLLALKADYKTLTNTEWKPVVAVSSGGDANDLSTKIATQGNLVRDLKAKKATKPEIDAAVKVLLDLKGKYKEVTGKDWTPTTTTVVAKVDDAAIVAQGNKVRELKAKKAEKSTIDEAVKLLLQLKADYKAATGQEWKPAAAAPNDADILSKIAAQGEKVRELKAKKAEKSVVDGEVKVLLQLKADYKALTGQEWKPGVVAKNQKIDGVAAAGGDDPKKGELVEKVNAQGNVVRELKAKKAPKVCLNGTITRCRLQC